MLDNIYNNSALINALKQGNNHDLFQTLQNALSAHFSIKLITFTLIDKNNARAKRLYSSDDGHYAIGGYKPIESNSWTTQVLEKQEAFIANTHDELASVFFDHALIAELGLGSVINWPVVVQSQVIGTINILAEEGAYQAVELNHFNQLTPWLALPFLLALTSEE